MLAHRGRLRRPFVAEGAFDSAGLGKIDAVDLSESESEEASGASQPAAERQVAGARGSKLSKKEVGKAWAWLNREFSVNRLDNDDHRRQVHSLLLQWRWTSC